MKIGIVTFHNHSNYGAVLQSYALQKAIESLGHDAYHLSFDDQKEIKNEGENNLPPFLKKIKEESSKRDNHFKNFRMNYLKENIYSKELEEETDLFIVGSDQVWNPAITNGDKRYFLKFTDKKKRISYAASFGEEFPGNFPDKLNEYFAESLSEFSSISVREQFGAQIVRALTKRDAEVNCDPVFLVDVSAWDNLLLKIEAPKVPYNLLIMVQNDMELYNRCKAEAECEGIELRVITASLCPPLGFEAWSGVDVQTYLSFIKYARKVITSSFHALAFSIIFDKRYEIVNNKDELVGRNQRLTELLKCIEYDGNSKQKDLVVSTWIEQERSKGYDYLRRTIESVK